MSSEAVKPKTSIACSSMWMMVPSLLTLISNSKETSFVLIGRSMPVSDVGSFPSSRIQDCCSWCKGEAMSESSGLDG